MAYIVVEKSQKQSKETLNKQASKDNFPAKTKRVKKLIEKVGLPKELKVEKAQNHEAITQATTDISPYRDEPSGSQNVRHKQNKNTNDNIN